MKLFIVHSHYRPGGVRRVIELGAPYVAASAGAGEVVLVGGEAPEAGWLRHFQARLAGVRVVCAVSPGVGYWAEQRRQRGAVEQELRDFWRKWLGGLGGTGGVVWAHNQGLGRNLVLTQELTRACAAHAVPVVFHHHDWWFDNRWQRWREMREAGFRTLPQVARVLFPDAPEVRHIAINHADAGVLERHYPGRGSWLPNLAEPGGAPLARRVEAARRWLRRELGEAGPVWLMPCRLLRRKNIAEALLLLRWLRPEAWLVTTGGISSADERAYARRLETAARQQGWRLRLSLLQGTERGKPAVPELVAASEAVLLTSLQEGFGLPYLEAAEAGKPLLARALPNIAPDLARFGFVFPQYYDEVLVAPELYDWPAELRRQQDLFAQWKRGLPAPCRRMVRPPALVANGRTPTAVPFSRLTLTAQLEVLRRPPEASWELCAPLNPFLRVWRELAGHGGLRPSAWPRSANRWLSGGAYQRTVRQLWAEPGDSAPPPERAEAAMREYMELKLHPDNLYPILWSTE